MGCCGRAWQTPHASSWEVGCHLTQSRWFKMRVDDVASKGLADIARHVTEYHLLKKRWCRVRVDDVAGKGLADLARLF